MICETLLPCQNQSASFERFCFSDITVIFVLIVEINAVKAERDLCPKVFFFLSSRCLLPLLFFFLFSKLQQWTQRKKNKKKTLNLVKMKRSDVGFFFFCFQKLNLVKMKTFFFFFLFKTTSFLGGIFKIFFFSKRVFQ